MRALILVGLLSALPSFAGEPSPEQRYGQDGWDLCHERHPVGPAEDCASFAVRSASILSAMERGVPVETTFALDGDADRTKAKAIAIDCRIQTMDGERVDAIYAMECVTDTIGRMNWEVRRAKRIAEEE